MKLKITLIFLIAISIASCKKADNYKDIPEEYKGYFLFQEGSSWVYKNQITNSNDSIILRSITREATKPDNNCDKYRFEYDLQFTNVTAGKLFHSGTTCVENASIYDGLTPAVFTVPPTLPTLFMDTVIADTTMYFNALVYYYFNDTMSVFSAYAKNIGRIKCYKVVNGIRTIDYELKRYRVSAF
jgi:hypothetical protein